MNNTEILNNLKNCNDEDNFKKCKELLPLWNNNESTFPSDLSVKNFIKLDKWSFEELNQISTELFINTAKDAYIYIFIQVILTYNFLKVLYCI